MSTTEDKDLEHLAVGFALDELEEGELDRFLSILQERDERSARAAHVTWQALRTTMDLRAALDGDFVPVTRSRIEESLHDRRDEKVGIVASVLGRLGASRPRLGPVQTPSGTERRRPRLLSAVVTLAAALVAVAVWWAWPESIRVDCTLVRGRASCEGRSFSAGGAAVLGGRPFNLHAGGLARLAWPSGTALELLGPAMVVPRRDGVSIGSGRAIATSDGSFTIGLPDRSLELDPGSTVVVQVLFGEGELHRSQVGVLAGTATASADSVAGPVEIQSDSYLSLDGTVHPWHRPLSLRPDENGARVAPALEPGATWRLTADFVPETPSTTCRLTDADGRLLEVGTARLVVRDASGRERDHELTGAPLRPRRLRIVGVGRSRIRIALSGLTDDAVIDFGPLTRIDDPDVMKDLELATGPDPDLE